MTDPVCGLCLWPLLHLACRGRSEGLSYAQGLTWSPRGHTHQPCGRDLPCQVAGWSAEGGGSQSCVLGLWKSWFSTAYPWASHFPGQQGCVLH